MATKNSINQSTVYTKSYQNMRGVSFSGDQSGSKNGRYAYLENMYVDYDSDSLAVESIPGFRKLYSFGEHINGVFTQNVGADKEYILVHAKDKLYRFEKSEKDSLENLEPIGTLENAKSSSFVFGTDIYILDGTKIYRVSADGSFTELGSEDCKPYVPTIFKNGEPYEDRNLLTNEFKESYKVGNALYEIYETPGLIFEVVDESKLTCEVAGINDNGETIVEIPSFKVIGDKRYRVIGIKEQAFSGNTVIEKLYTYFGLEYVGVEAFFRCTALNFVSISDSVKTLGDRSFHGATALHFFMVGQGLEKFGAATFGPAEDLSICFRRNEEEVRTIENYQICESYTRIFRLWWPGIDIGIKVHSPMKELLYVSVDGVVQEEFGNKKIFTYAPEYDEKTQMLKLICYNRPGIEEKTVEICGILKNEPTEVDSLTPDFFSSVMGNKLTPLDAVIKCTKATTFDGRIFLTGNPALGGTVFYSSSDGKSTMSPLYFGSRCYFIDGLGDYKVTSIMTSGETLTVFKNGDDGSGSIFYHTPNGEASRNLRTYPLSYVHTGVRAMGGSFNFFDDPLFMCDMGVCSLEKSTVAGFREVKCRSSAINQKLLPENAENISFAEWCGYLVLSSGGKMFLADSRESYTVNGERRYEWYYLSGIGTYDGDMQIYRYASVAPNGFYIHENIDGAIENSSDVMSRMLDDGETVYYTEENGKSYAVYPTGERVNGNFSAAEQVLGCDKLLFFFTASGDMCVFNNDKRGVAPYEISSSPNYSEEEYPEDMKNRIHPYFYSFAGHAPRYAVQTVSDDCDTPYLTKKSVRSSLVIKCKSPVRSFIVCKAGTDTGSYTERAALPPSKWSFDTLDFSSMAFLTDEYSTVPIAEGERGWISKQITVIGEEYCSPIGVYSINYQYKIKGKIRKNQEVI